MSQRPKSWRDSFDEFFTLTRIRALACLLALVASVSYLEASGRFLFPYDDSYISLEFARNFASYGRLTYDGIHPAPGATSLLHVLLLALAASAKLPLDTSNAVLGVLFFVLAVDRTAMLAWGLTRSPRATLFTAIVTALNGYLVYDSLNGLETTLFIFLIVGWIAALIASLETRRTSAVSAVWLFLALLTRPEAEWALAGVGLYLGVRFVRRPSDRPRLKMFLTSFVAVAFLAAAAQWLLTGSIVSHTALAKVYLFGDIRSPFELRVRIFWQALREVWQPLYFFLLLVLCAGRSRRLLRMLVPWAALTEILFCWLLPGQVSTYEGRYQHPLMPFVFVLAGDGIENLTAWLAQYRTGRWARTIFLALAAILCGLSLRENRVNLRDDKQIILDNHFWAVDWLRQHAPPGARIATHDIGILRYVGGYDLVDLSGLTNLEAFERNRTARGQFDYLAGKRPDYLVGIDFWLDGYLHYFPALDCCAIRVAQAEPHTPTTIRLSIFRCHWDTFKPALSPSAPYERR